jgi:hypothetical protein
MRQPEGMARRADAATTTSGLGVTLSFAITTVGPFGVESAFIPPTVAVPLPVVRSLTSPASAPGATTVFMGNPSLLL